MSDPGRGGAVASVLSAVLGALLGAAVLGTLLLSTGSWRWGAPQPATGAPPAGTSPVTAPPVTTPAPLASVAPGQEAACRERHGLTGGETTVPPDLDGRPGEAPVVLRGCAWPAPGEDADGYFEVTVRVVAAGDAGEARAWVLRPTCERVAVGGDGAAATWAASRGERVRAEDGRPADGGDPGLAGLPAAGEHDVVVVAGTARALGDVRCVPAG